MILLEAVLEGPPAGFAGWPGGNGKEVKVSEVPAEITGGNYDDRLPENLAQGADHKIGRCVGYNTFLVFPGE